MNIYSQVLEVISRNYTPNQIPEMVKALTDLRCAEARKVVCGPSDGRLVRLLNDMIEALDRVRKAYSTNSPMAVNRQAQELMSCDNVLRKYCKRMLNMQ